LFLWVGVAFGQQAVQTDAAQTALTADATLEAAATGLRLQGWTARESASTPAAATLILRHDGDGTCDSTNVIAFIELTGDQSVNMWYGNEGIRAAAGVCADVLAGTVDINLYFSRR